MLSLMEWNRCAKYAKLFDGKQIPKTEGIVLHVGIETNGTGNHSLIIAEIKDDFGNTYCRRNTRNSGQDSDTDMTEMLRQIDVCIRDVVLATGIKEDECAVWMDHFEKPE